MELRVLKYFLETAEKGSLAKAAESLLTTAPNISRQLRDLEEELGTKLFVKSGRGMELTEEGLLLKSRAREILSLAERTEQDIRSKADEISGTVCIGAAETPAMHEIAKLVRKLQCEHPGITFRFHSGDYETVTEGLDSGVFDFGILAEPADVRKYGHQKLPAVDQWGLLMREDDPLAALPSIRPQDLEGAPLMCSAQMLEGKGLSAWLGKPASSLHYVLTYNLITTPAMMVEEGVGCALTFKDLVRTEGTGLTFRRLNPRLETALFLVWREDLHRSRAAQTFLDAFTQAK